MHRSISCYPVELLMIYPDTKYHDDLSILGGAGAVKVEKWRQNLGGQKVTSLGLELVAHKGF